jgi:hypothetical protein
MNDCICRIVNRATFCNDGLRELRHGVQLGIAGRAPCCNARTLLDRQLRFFQCDSGMTRNAEVATVNARRRDLHHFALGQRQAGFGIDAGNGHVGFQRLRRIGQHADQIRQEAVVGNRFFNEWAAVGWSGLNGMHSKTGHGRPRK